MSTIIIDRNPGAYEAITVSNTAVGFTDSCINPTTGMFKRVQCKEIFAVVETDAIRYTVDGATTPTDAIGIPVSAGQNITIRNVQAIKNFKMIRQTTDASVKVQYYF